MCLRNFLKRLFMRVAASEVGHFLYSEANKFSVSETSFPLIDLQHLHLVWLINKLQGASQLKAMVSKTKYSPMVVVCHTPSDTPIMDPRRYTKYLDEGSVCQTRFTVQLTESNKTPQITTTVRLKVWAMWPTKSAVATFQTPYNAITSPTCGRSNKLKKTPGRKHQS